MRQPKRWVVWAICFGFGIVVSVALLHSSGILMQTDPLSVYSSACDAFFVPGILLLSFGLLGLVSKEGIFDALGYGMRSLLVLFTPLRSPEKHERYYEYRLRRSESRKQPRSNIPLITGAIFLIAASVCLAMYAMAGGL